MRLIKLAKRPMTTRRVTLNPAGASADVCSASLTESTPSRTSRPTVKLRKKSYHLALRDLRIGYHPNHKKTGRRPI